MSRFTRRFVAVAVLVALGSLETGCFGSFELVHKVYNFNQRVSSDKFVRTLIFWVLVIIPIYQFCAIGDAVILNLIEFWTGRNPLAMKDGETHQRVVEADGKTTTLTFADRGQTVRIEIAESGHATQRFEFHGDGTSAELRDGAGHLLSSGAIDASGGVEVVDADGMLLDRRSAAEVARLGTVEDPRALASILRPRPEALVCSLP